MADYKFNPGDNNLSQYDEIIDLTVAGNSEVFKDGKKIGEIDKKGNFYPSDNQAMRKVILTDGTEGYVDIQDNFYPAKTCSKGR